MHRAANRTGGHLSPIALQRIAALGSAGAKPREVQHLAQCAGCMESYAALAAVHATYLAREPPEAAALRVARPPPASAFTRVEPAAASRATRSTPRRRWFALLPAAALGAVAFFALVRHEGPAGASQIAVQHRMRQDAYGSLLYAADLLPIGNGTRGAAGLAPEILQDCSRAFRDAPGSESACFWFIGSLVASTQTESARPQVLAALAKFPRSARLENLAAIVAFKRSDLPDAEQHLRRALALDRDVAFVFNLRRVLQQQGRVEEAELLRTEILARDPAGPIAQLVDRAEPQAPAPR